MEAYALVLVTLPATIPAAALTVQLLEQRLIAGVNVLPDVLTRYRDTAGLQETRETLYVCRTLPEHIAALHAAIQALTGERDFEISVLAAEAGNPAYSAWIRRALTPLPPSG
jgi:periplasmic divalent cation tolerance protein